jgi:ribose 5-phosphate isomerase A
VLDLAIEPLDDPRHFDERLHAIPGVVETGLFIGRADVVIVAGEGGVRQLTR